MSTVRATNFQHASATNPAIVLAADGSATANVSSINGGPLAGFRNAIINGNFDVWQRGTSFSSPASDTYLADRWLLGFDGSGATRTISRQAFPLGQTDVPAEPTYFLRYAQSVAGTGGTASNFQHRIEGVRAFAGQQVTISFYAKAASSITLPNIFANQVFGAGGSPSATVVTVFASSVVIGTSWARYSYTVTLPSISSKTIGSNVNDCLITGLSLPTNATFTFDIAQVQVEPGPVATPFERRPIGTELALCQRYYETGVVGGATNTDANFSAGAIASAIFTFMTEKRATPTLTARDSAGTDNRFNGALNLTGSAGQIPSAGALVTYARPGSWGTDVGAATAGNRFSYKYEASAEL